MEMVRVRVKLVDTQGKYQMKELLKPVVRGVIKEKFVLKVDLARLLGCKHVWYA